MSQVGPGPASGASYRGEFPVAFGRYLLLKRLSRGGMGEIFLAKVGEIQGFEKFVIIKKILPQLAANDDFITRFIDEAQVAIKLNHVNIAQVFEVGRVDGEYFLAIEFIDGRDLRRLLRRCRETGTRLPIDLCVFIARDLAAGLAYAHRRTVAKGQALALVHCDISPPNVMVSYEGEVKIIDFGIARSALRTADSNPNIGFGKFGYMAPEQLIRGGVIDRRTDIYAAGVVLYELLTGERLYQFPEGTDYRQMARTVCQGNYLAPSLRDSRLDASMDAILAKALAVKQEDRYQTAEDFRDALQHKLSSLNPTISADRLARVMDELFSTERQTESDELAQMRAVDSSAYKEELGDAKSHTVTFARALEAGMAAADATTVTPQLDEEAKTTMVPSGRIESSEAAAGSLSLTPSYSQTSAQRKLWGLPLLLGALAFGLVMLLGLIMWPRAPVDAPPKQTNQPAPSRPVVEALPNPTPTPDLALPPSPPIEPMKPPTEVPKPAPIRKPTTKPVTTQPRPIKEPIAPEAVDRKFQQVRAEYLDFKRNFGARLEESWQQILSDIALGRRDQRVWDALDALRKEMKSVRETSAKQK
ncbi:MAG: protein kinase [Myxococcales bacterium]|nr:protein kinase [Myxococcales bacterium]